MSRAELAGHREECRPELSAAAGERRPKAHPGHRVAPLGDDLGRPGARVLPHAGSATSGSRSIRGTARARSRCGSRSYFHYLCAENGAACAGAIAEMLAFRYRPAAEVRSLRSARDAGRMARDWSRFARSRRRRATPLMKDPIALFSAEWLADTFDMRVLVMIRHPASFATSIRRRGWRHRFADFLEQPLLMRDLLAPYADEIRAASDQRL